MGGRGCVHRLPSSGEGPSGSLLLGRPSSGSTTGPRGASEPQAVGWAAWLPEGSPRSVAEPARRPTRDNGHSPHGTTATARAVTTAGRRRLCWFPTHCPDVPAHRAPAKGCGPSTQGRHRGSAPRRGRSPPGTPLVPGGPTWTHLDQARRGVPSLLKVLLPMLLLNFQSKARPQNALQVIRIRPCAGGHSPHSHPGL